MADLSLQQQTTIARSADHTTRTAWVRIDTLLILLVALIQGLIYISIVPPWQHYDEPTHFEYAWLLANWQRRPAYGEVDPVMRREVAASMIANNFYWNLTPPSLLAEGLALDIGILETVHPPAYYLLVSGPLWLARNLDIETQLYVARTVSLALLIATVAIAIGLMRDLTPPGHILRWSAPLTLALIPPFVDLMTAVNNDVGAITVFSLFLWLSVRVIRYGFGWVRVLLLIGTAVLGVLTKNTASIALILLPLVLVMALWARQQWRWRWLVGSVLGAAALLAPITVAWGDAAYWYRATYGGPQAADTRQPIADAPLGDAVLDLELNAQTQGQTLINPVLTADLQKLAGRRVTVGGWVWASEPLQISSPGLLYTTTSDQTIITVTKPVTVTTEPVFVAQHVVLPRDTDRLQFLFAPAPATLPASGVRLFLDGATIVPGGMPLTTAPAFTDRDGRSGTWGGRTFINALRNGSSEQAWPRIRPWLDELLVRYVRRSPAQVFAAALDVERTGPILVSSAGARVLFSFFGTFGWAHVNMEGRFWMPLFGVIVGVGVGGGLRWMFMARRSQRNVSAALALLLIAGVVVWGNAIFRVLPVLQPPFLLPVARYGFPAALPAVLLLAGGWWALVPRRYGWASALLLVGLMAGLNIAAYWTITNFYQSLLISWIGAR